MADEQLDQPIAGPEPVQPIIGTGPTGMPDSQAMAESGEIPPGESGGEVLPEELGGDDEVLRINLDRDFSELRDADQKFNTQKYVTINKIKQMKLKTLKEFFAMMQEMGVDPSNRESVAQFIKELEQIDPDLVTLLESFISELDPENVGKPMPKTGGNLMEMLGNQQENIIRK